MSTIAFFKTDGLAIRLIFRFALAIGLLGFCTSIPAAEKQKNWSPLECQWLKGYVRDSSQNGIFPLGPTEVTWAVGSPPDAPLAHKEKHKSFVKDSVDEFGLPVSSTDDQEDAQVLVYFHTKQETKDDIEKILTELRSVPRVSVSYPEGYPLLYEYSYDQCSFTYIPSADNPVSKINIQIPFDRKTGLPVVDAKRCVAEGLVKAFGISLQDMGTGRTGWTAGCPRCLEADLHMALILIENNKAKRSQLSSEQMFGFLGGATCRRT